MASCFFSSRDKYNSYYGKLLNNLKLSIRGGTYMAVVMIGLGVMLIVMGIQKLFDK